jgi:DNA (cytosine-5)-methyltransferase 1
MTRPRILDLFCGGGGAAVGYHRAGFDVVGVDVVAQPNYPFHFHRGDALDALRVYLTRDAGIDGSRAWQPFDAIHASPPCKRFTAARGDRHANRLFEPHTDYLRPTLAALSAVALPWIVENVPNAPMPPGAVTLCGSSFDLDVRRHRLFASNVPIRGLACRHADQERGRYPSLDWERRSSGRRAAVVGVHGSEQYPGHHADAAAAMGIDWMPWDRLTQAVPPAYTEYLGRQLIAYTKGEPVITTAARLHDLRRASRTPVAYPSEDFDASRAYLAGAVPELLDTIEILCRVIAAEREGVR